MKDTAMKIVPIGLIHSPFKDTGGTPIQPHYAKGVRGTVEIEPKFAEGLRDLDGFERIWLIYWFHRSRPYELTVVPYRDTVPRGLFATRAPSRPNSIGLTSVKLLEVSGNRLVVEDVDILDETPLLDIKPYVPKADAYECQRIGWLQSNAADRDRADDRFDEDEKR